MVFAMAKEKKTYSLDTTVIAAVEREARLQGTYPSAYVNNVLLQATNADDARRLGKALRDIEGKPDEDA